MNPKSSLRNALTAVAFGTVLMAATASRAAVTISTDATRNENCSGGVCSPTDKTANLNVGDLQTMLAASDVTVKTAAGAIAIGVLDALTWTSTHRLTLASNGYVHIKAPVVIEGTGALTLTYGGLDDELVFENGGTVNFWDMSSDLIINGESYALVGDIQTLASDIAADPTGRFALANNYDASRNGTYGAAPIQTKFRGALEGLGNTISNLTIVSSGAPQRNLALFAVSYARLCHLNLTNAFVSDGSSGSYVGTLVGTNSGRIEWVTATGKISGNGSELGGLVGGNGSVGDNNGGSIFHTRSAVTVGGTAIVVGGIVGYNSGVIRWSQASGAVQGLDVVGGLAGDLAGGTIRQSFASGPVRAEDVTPVGGLVGVVQYTPGHLNTLEQCYATGKVASSYANGGLVGQEQNGTVSQCYATGRVPDRSYSGGLIGRIYGAPPDFTAGYWDKTTTRQGKGTGSGDIDGLIGLTDAQLKSALPAGFDPAVWGQSPNINNGWPYLLANPPQ